MLKKVFLRFAGILAALTIVFLVLALWGPTGALVVEPLIRKYGSAVVPSPRIGNVGGSLYSGITLHDVELVSGDTVLLSASRFRVRPAWDQLLRGVLWLSDLEIDGLSLKAEDLETLAAHYGGSGSSSGSTEIRPLRVTLSDISFITPLYSVNLEEGFLTRDGSLFLSADMGGLPVRLNGSLAFAPLEARSIDVAVGSGHAFLNGRLTAPFDIRGGLDSIRVGELLTVLTPLSGDGEIGGSFTVAGSGDTLKARGALKLDQGRISGIPVDAFVPWNYEGGNLVVTQAKIESLSADIVLGVSADLRADPLTDRFFARGSIKNISMKKIEQALSLKAPVEGEKGILDFWVSADQTGATAGKLFVRVPELKANGKRIVNNLRSSLYLSPDGGIATDSTGEIFGARLTGRGEILQDSKLHPSMTFALDGLDLALVAQTFPELAAAAPKGILSGSLKVGKNSTGLTAEAVLRSERLTLMETNINNLTASARYEGQKVLLEGLRGKIGRAPLDISGNLDLRTSALHFDGGVTGLNPRSVPLIPESVEGVGNIGLSVRGTLKSPRATVSLSSNELKIAGLPLKRPRFAGTYADNSVSIPETILLIPDGSVSFRGDIALPPGKEPNLNLSGKLTNLDLRTFSKELESDISGRLEGNLKVSGPLSAASVSATIHSDRIQVDSTDIRDLSLDVAGTTRKVDVRSIKAKINEGTLEGKGNFSFNLREKMKVDMKVKGLEVRTLLRQFGMDLGIGGYLNGSLILQGTLARPELTLKVVSPLTVKETLLDRLTLTIVSPARGKLDINATAKLGELMLNIKGDMQRQKREWTYAFDSGKVDLDQLIAAKSPSMKGTVGGKVEAKVTGKIARGKQNPINVHVSLPRVSASGLEIKNIDIPVVVLGDQAMVRDGKGALYGGTIGISADVYMPDEQWLASVSARNVDIGALTHTFLKDSGAVVASADAEVQLKGDYGTLMMVFGNGHFLTSSGYIHKIKQLESISKTGKITFDVIRGSFFWDGNDLWLNPGTEAIAGRGDPLYKRFAISGSMGVPGKGLDLNCLGNFDVKLLDTILGALKGVFQYFTGSLSGGGAQVVRSAVGRMLGIEERDFQDVSFNLRGSWSELQLLNLKIDKSLEQYLTPDLINKTEEEKKQERKFQLNLKIPTGPGGATGEEAEEQFKRQLLDNLFDQF